MKKKPTVTIGIPAYNEEANIKRLLSAIVAQRETDFVIKKIVVISDKSNDNTVTEVKKINDKRIQLIENRRRLGQIYCQNKIFSLADTNVVVLFEADTYPATNYYLHELLKPLFGDSTLGLVQGVPQPVLAKTLTEKVLRTQVRIYQKFLDSNSNSPGQGGRAFSRFVYSRLRWLKALPEDTFALMWCKQRGIKARLQITAQCIYRCPQSYSDFVKKQQKIESGSLAMSKRFDPKLIENICRNSRFNMIGVRMATFFFVKHPIYFFVYALFKLSLMKELKKTQYTDFLPIAWSTKKLV